MFDGGSNLLDYRLWTDSASSGATFTVLAVSLSDTNYIVTNTIQGSEYQFKVEVRNKYGYSAFSETVSVLSS